MGVEEAKTHLAESGMADRVRAPEGFCATVVLAVQALGGEPARIAKTLSFLLGGQAILVVAAGNAKIDNPRCKTRLGAKAKMLAPEEAETLVGHAVDGLCSFWVRDGGGFFRGVAWAVRDHVSRLRHGHSAIDMTLSELERVSGDSLWIDVCKNWQATPA